MATTKLWAVSNHLKRVQDYALDEEKTSKDLYNTLAYAENEDKTEHQYYVRGINCHPSRVYEQFTKVKEAFEKTDGVLAYHGYMSFAPGEVTPEEAMDIASEFAQKMWGDRYQVLVTAHLNTECLHCHIVVNSVSFIDGKKIADNEKNWNKFHHLADEICRAHGKSVVEERSGPKPTKRDRFVKNLLDSGLERCKNLNELQDYLEKRGHQCKFDENLKYWTITPKGWTKPYRIKHLEKVFPDTDYSKEKILSALSQAPEGTYTRPKPQTYMSYKNLYKRRAERVFNQVMDGLYQASRITKDLSNILRGRYYAPLMRYRSFYKPSAGMHYTRDYEAERNINEWNDRIHFITRHNIHNEADLKKVLEEEQLELQKLFREKELLTSRSQYENVSKDLKRVQDRIKEIYKHKKIGEYYLQEDKEQWRSEQ